VLVDYLKNADSCILDGTQEFYRKEFLVLAEQQRAAEKLRCWSAITITHSNALDLDCTSSLSETPPKGLPAGKSACGRTWVPNGRHKIDQLKLI